MRISTSYQFETYTRDIALAEQRSFDSQQQITTGKRINKPSDDPFGTASLISRTSLKSALDQYNKNLQTANSTLGFTDNALQEAGTISSQAYSLAISGSNAATDQVSQNAMASEITQMQSRLIDLANSRGPNGQYLFAGQKNDAPPFSINSGAVVYNGDSGSVNVETSPTSVLMISTPGQKMYTDAYNALENLKNNLLGGNTTNIAASIDEIKKTTDTINQTRGQVGASIKTAQQLTDENTRRTDDLTKSISDTQDVDMSVAITQYQLAQTAYQAALSVASQGYKLSLLNFIQGA